MFVCEICDQELSESEMADFEDNICRECAGDNDGPDPVDDGVDDAYDRNDRDYPDDDFDGL